jgi:hypothetical protein
VSLDGPRARAFPVTAGTDTAAADIPDAPMKWRPELTNSLQSTHGTWLDR